MLPMYKELENRSPSKFGRHASRVTGGLMVADPTYIQHLIFLRALWTYHGQIEALQDIASLQDLHRSSVLTCRILLMAFSTLAVLFIFLSVAGYVAFGPTASWQMKPCGEDGKGKAPDFKTLLPPATAMLT